MSSSPSRLLPALAAVAALASPLALAQQVPPAPAASPASVAPELAVPELTGLDKIQDARTLRAAIRAARERLASVEDPEERALAQSTLDSAEATPAELAPILSAHTARLAEIRAKVPETLFLTGLTRCKTPQEVVRFARETYANADKLGDPSLRRTVRFTLAKLEDRPGESAEILKEHLKAVGDRFYGAAMASFAANDAPAALSAIQIAVRCSPENVKARFLFAHLLSSAMGDTDKAIQTMRVGLAHLEPSSPDTPGYLDRYFQLLEMHEHDDEVITQTATLLGKDGFDERAREMLAMHLATCLQYVNRFDDALRVIEKHSLGKRAQGKLLEARCLFDGRRTDAATRALESSAGNFQGAERDALLSQLQRFWTELGRDSLALSVADQRIREFPDKSSPRVHRLWIFDRMGDRVQFGNETRLLFERFSEDQGAMLGLANLAAERGMSALAGECFRRAQSHNFNKPLFALLIIEAHVNAREYREAVNTHARLLSYDKGLFKGSEHTVHALLAAAKTGIGDPVSKNEAERHVRALLDARKPLPPATYVSCAKLLRRAGDTQSALKILETGRRLHPWNNQVRADLAAVRILAGQTEAYGTRPAIEDELISIAKGRRVHPRLWDTVATWLQTEAKLPLEKLRPLRELSSAMARPDLARDSVRE